MPLPMVHLAIAVGLYAQQQKPLSPEFVLGSLAPDAIHMREGWTRADKKVTHLGLPDDYPDWSRMQPILAAAKESTPARIGLTAGYIAHLLTDQYWIESVVIPTRELVPPHLSQEERRALYYQETDQVDFNFYHHAPWRRDVWNGLAKAVAMDFPPLLHAAEIDGWRQRTLRWFDDETKEPGKEPVYYTDALVADFVERATVVVGDGLEIRGLLSLL